LSYLGEGTGEVVLDLDELVVERVAGIDRVEDLLDGPPALAWSLLEQAHRVSVAIAQIAQL
jgi:hypothetical protein